LALIVVLALLLGGSAAGVAPLAARYRPHRRRRESADGRVGAGSPGWRPGAATGWAAAI